MNRTSDSSSRSDAVQRAEKWIRSIVRCDGNDFDYDSLEAVVYAASRGFGSAQLRQSVDSAWRHNSQRALPEAFAAGIIPSEDASHVEHATQFQVWDFWRGSILDQTCETIDMTMLRVAEWLDLGGYSAWWKRSAREQVSMVADGFHAEQFCDWAAQVSRSAYAMTLYRDAIETGLTLTAIRLKSETMTYLPDEKVEPRLIEWNGFVAQFLFAAARSDVGKSLVVSPEALGGLLLARQSPSGCWSGVTAETEPDLGTTAWSINALAATRPHGFVHSIRRAADWLIAQQDEDGGWCGNKIWCNRPFVVTLVLDAIALGYGDYQTSITGWRSEETPATPPVPTPESDSAIHYIDLDQAAALVSRSKKTLERKLREGSMPMPDIEGGGGKKHEWVYSKLRPWLENEYGRVLPTRPPHTIR